MMIKPLNILVVDGKYKVTHYVSKHGRPFIIVLQPGRRYHRGQYLDVGGTAWYLRRELAMAWREAR